jgi:hypothetical protein
MQRARKLDEIMFVLACGKQDIYRFNRKLVSLAALKLVGLKKTVRKADIVK